MDKKGVDKIILILIIAMIVVIFLISYLIYRGGGNDNLKIIEFSVSPEKPIAGQEAVISISLRDNDGIRGFQISFDGIKIQVDCNNQKTCIREVTQKVPDIQARTVTLNLIVEDSTGKRTKNQKDVVIIHETSNPICGNNLCESGETELNCLEDCEAPSPEPPPPSDEEKCGDNFCDSSIGEDELSCPSDCEIGPICGDNVCEDGETELSCPNDCKITGSNKNRFGGDLLWYGIFNFEDTSQVFSESVNDLNVGIVRYDVYWGKLEPQKGVYNWTLTDELVNSIGSDIDIVFTVYSTSEWGSKYNDCRIKGAEALEIPVSKIYNGPPSSIPIDLQDYLNFLDVFANRYKDRVEYWQIENEVHGAGAISAIERDIEGCLFNRFWIGNEQEYVDLLKNSYEKLKQINPDFTVFESSLVTDLEMKLFWDRGNFTNYVLDNGRDYTDILDLHLYECPDDDPSKINHIKNWINDLGYDKPLWVTESGQMDIRCHTEQEFKNSFGSSEELKFQSEETIKRHVLSFSNDVEKMFLLRLNTYPNDQGPTSPWTHMGLTFDEYGQNKKPGYYTYQLMISKLKEFNTAEMIDENTYKFEFSNKNPVYVLWSDSGNKEIDLSPQISSSNIMVTDIITELGKTVPETKIVQTNEILITSTPIFVEEN